MDGFDRCTLYLLHTWPTSLSSVWWDIAWKTAVRAASLNQKIEEIPWNRDFVTRGKPWKIYRDISKGETLLNLKTRAYVPCISPSGLIFLIATYSLVSRRIFFTNFIKAFSRTISFS